MIASYARAVVAAGLAVLMNGNTDLKAIVIAMISAISGPLLRWVNPKDPAFGRGSN